MSRISVEDLSIGYALCKGPILVAQEQGQTVWKQRPLPIRVSFICVSSLKSILRSPAWLQLCVAWSQALRSSGTPCQGSGDCSCGRRAPLAFVSLPVSPAHPWLILQHHAPPKKGLRFTGVENHVDDKLTLASLMASTPCHYLRYNDIVFALHPSLQSWVRLRVIQSQYFVTLCCGDKMCCEDTMKS